MNEEAKIATLREFVSTLVENTKLETQGRSGSPNREKRAAAKVLGIILGRRAKSTEINHVLMV